MIRQEQELLQRIFDTCGTHLLTQNERSEGISTCMYRGKTGLMCGIGPMFKDYAYGPELEGLPVESPTVLDALRDSGWMVGSMVSCRLLHSIQFIHDNKPPSAWPEYLRMVAYENRLNTDAIDACVRAKHVVMERVHAIRERRLGIVEDTYDAVVDKELEDA